ncbi:MAG: ribosome small subunit-dependent GTPase A [Actinomycetota bacterium]|nr:ribosome small subunit-dependent GTPase A [Actinomycetota bacterium]
MTASLLDLGWRPSDVDADRLHHHPHSRPARVTQQQRGAWLVHDGSEEVLARARGAVLDPAPVTGDWLLVSGDARTTCYVDEVLPRRSTLSRAEAGGRSQEQVIAANVDVVGICAPADDVNERRLERELTAVWASGAVPLVIITKADAVDDPKAVATAAAVVCIGADVVATSTVSGEGLDGVRDRLGPGVTLALIGPSGVGKSSLVNALAGHEVLATQATRQDGKGRHTTTGRHLVPLAGVGLLLDTPGMREFAPWFADEGLGGTFADIDELAASCRFADCRHDSEPGCAVLTVAAGDAEIGARVESWRKLQRELAWLERRQDARLRQEERRQWIIRERAMRRSIRST